MYARALVARNMEAPDGSRPAGLVELLDIMQKENRAREGRSLADIAFASGFDSPELARTILELRPEHPEDLTDRDRRLFSGAVEIGCRPPYERAHRRQCWVARAF